MVRFFLIFLILELEKLTLNSVPSRRYPQSTEAISNFLGQEATLTAILLADQSFANEAPLLLINLASCRALDVNPIAFRANIQVDLTVPFLENSLVGQSVCMGGTEYFDVTAKCVRCDVITYNQDTGESDKIGMQRLMRERGCLEFGVYLRWNRGTGKLKVGDQIQSST